MEEKRTEALQGPDPLVLLVEDNEHEREIFRRYLEFVGYDVVAVEDGVEGLRTARQQCPSLIFLDLSMPRMDGWEMISRLKADPALKWTPVVALTARHLGWSQLEEAGFCGYLEKPIAPFRVLEELERCLVPGRGSHGGSRGGRREQQGSRSRSALRASA